MKIFFLPIFLKKKESFQAINRIEENLQVRIRTRLVHICIWTKSSHSQKNEKKNFLLELRFFSHTESKLKTIKFDFLLPISSSFLLCSVHSESGWKRKNRQLHCHGNSVENFLSGMFAKKQWTCWSQRKPMIGSITVVAVTRWKFLGIFFLLYWDWVGRVWKSWIFKYMKNYES